MFTRPTCMTLVLFTIGLPVGMTLPGATVGAAQNDLYREKRFRHACKPPLKFAAGACVRHCPAGYRDTGRTCRTCRFRNMSR